MEDLGKKSLAPYKQKINELEETLIMYRDRQFELTEELTKALKEIARLTKLIQKVMEEKNK